MWSSNIVQAVRYGTLCSTRTRPAQNTASSPGRVSAQPQMRGSPHGVQGAGTTLSRVGCTAVHQHDRIHKSKHSALWISLSFYGVKPAYVRLLQRLYSQTVLTDKESELKEERSKVTHCPLYCSTQCCNTHWKKI